MAPKKNTKAAASSKTKPSTAKGSRKASAKTAKLSTSKQRCVVVGSSFLDYVGYCDRVPAAGETVHSSSFQKGFGGKGANQAFMVAILKGKFDVSMVTAVGADGDGEAYINNLKAVGIDTQFVQQVKGDSTGLAMISVSTLTGQNQIVICPNATHKFTPDTVDWDSVFGKKDASHSSSSISSPSALVVQNEIPIATTLRALKEASDRLIAIC